MLVLGFKLSRDIAAKNGKPLFRQGQTVWARKREGSMVKVCGPRNGRASYRTAWVDAENIRESLIHDADIGFVERHRLPEILTAAHRRALDPTA